MLESLKKLAESYGIDPSVALIIVSVLSILGALVSFAYKENLFGLKNIIRKVFKAKPEDKIDGVIKSDKADLSAVTPTVSTVEETLILTSSVRFENERLPNALDLQKAVHIIKKSKSSCSVPFLYDARVAFLKQKIENLYEQYEQRMEKARGKVALEDLSVLRGSIDLARGGLNGLPNTVGLAVERLLREQTELNDVDITKVCSRFVELRMTQILAAMARYQLKNDDTPILLDYAGLRARHSDYVAHVDGIVPNALVSYRIQFIGDYEERIVFAPGMYGNEWLPVLAEFNAKGRGYFPPLRFMTDYSYPQMLFWYVDNPNKWTFEWGCESVNVKDLQGNYIDEYDNKPHEDLKE